MILLDTQAVLWLSLAPEKLSAAAIKAIEDSRRMNEGIGMSDRTLWELAMMVSKGRVDTDLPLREFLHMFERQCAIFPMSVEVAAQSVSFSEAFPKDPSDRVIAATALVHGLSLVTKDGLIRKSGEVPTIW
jgi:PIN domain nuclease of toxin-antitoxin system